MRQMRDLVKGSDLPGNAPQRVAKHGRTAVVVLPAEARFREND